MSDQKRLFHNQEALEGSAAEATIKEAVTVRSARITPASTTTTATTGITSACSVHGGGKNASILILLSEMVREEEEEKLQKRGKNLDEVDQRRPGRFQDPICPCFVSKNH